MTIEELNTITPNISCVRMGCKTYLVKSVNKKTGKIGVTMSIYGDGIYHLSYKILEIC